MKPESIGRVLGVGLRVAGRIAGQTIMGEGQTPANGAGGNAAGVSTPDVSTGQAGNRARAARQVSRGVVKGVGGFLRPFRQVGGKIWLEVTGVFFLLPVVVFVPTLWRSRFSWEHGPDHRTFVVSAIVVLIFFYLGVSSFWRARRK